VGRHPVGRHPVGRHPVDTQSIRKAHGAGPPHVLTYTPVLGNRSMHCSTFGAPNRYIHAVVRAVLPGRRTACTHEKITIFRNTLKTGSLLDDRELMTNT
jgi:hypothetical protein